MTEGNRRLVHAGRPTGMVDARTTRLVEAEVPAPGAALVRAPRLDG